MSDPVLIKPLPKVQKRKFAHALILKTAQEMAREVYEECASMDNDWYRKWPDRRNYVRKSTPYFCTLARQQLAKMLAMPSVPESQKQEIAAALVADAGFEADKHAVQDFLTKHGVSGNG